MNLKDEEASIWEDDYSAAATVIPIDPPLPLLRCPIPAGPTDDPSTGPFLLAFPDAATWRAARRVSESKIIEQCQTGARVGCSINASNKCKPPWWKSFLGFSAEDYAQRERCEEREMASCLAASKEACVQFAKEKTLLPFQDARIALVNPKGVANLLYWASRTVENSSDSVNMELKMINLQHEAFLNLHRCNAEVTNYRGSTLMEKSSTQNI